jgi:putative zinc finger/helix-turn-helix YgiT family protein
MGPQRFKAIGLHEKINGNTRRKDCPGCARETTVRKANREEVYNIRGEEIIIPEEFFVCGECGEEFDDPKSNNNPVEKAYREYRKRKNMTQPEDIKAFRKKFNLTQKEFSSLLGWGGATLSRYKMVHCKMTHTRG